MSFEHRHFERAEDLLRALRLTNNDWLPDREAMESSWVFRGHQQENWKLLPKAWRQEPILEATKTGWESQIRDALQGNDLLPHIEYFAKDENDAQHIIENAEKCKQEILVEFFSQLFSEVEVVAEFVSVADNLGLPIWDGNQVKVPGHGIAPLARILTDHLGIMARQSFLYIGGDKLPKEIDLPNSSVFGLAQHHGIATRLLDWTRNPLFAAFFAAENVDPDETDYSIAVWAINRRVENIHRTHRIAANGVVFVRPPRNTIGFLHAQDALFSYDSLANYRYLRRSHWFPIEDVLGLAEETGDFLRKLTLPASEAGELLKLLWIEGVSRAQLMPTYDNVTEAIKLRKRWQA